MKFILIFVSLVLCWQNAAGYNILGIFHTPGRSHYILAAALVKGLAEAGHNVTIVAPHKLPKSVTNIREVVLNVEPSTKLSKNLFDQPDNSMGENLESVLSYGLKFTDDALSDPNMQSLMKSKEQFDVIIVELFLSETLLGLGKIFNAPMIGFNAFGASKWTTDLNGSPSPISYVPHPYFTFSDRMTFIQRLGNTLITTFEYVFMGLAYNHRHEALYNKHFADPKPKLDELKRTGLPLILLNSHFSLSYPRPLLPNMVEIGGFHIDKKPKPLPQDLKEVLDSETKGVIYFSMGSTLQSADLPTEKRTALLRAFSKLPMKVLWKFEDDSLPGKPDNVLIRKWFPQNDVLAHPNVKLFITHGGLLSTMEATWFGVPVVGIPIYGDQMMNMGKAQAAGYGRTVSLSNLTEESISWAVNEVLNNQKYSQKAKAISSRFRDQESDPMERAIYWTEYVARHEGARHLVSGAQELSFIQYHNLDVFAVLLLVPVLLILIPIWIIKKLFCKGGKSSQKRDLKKKQK